MADSDLRALVPLPAARAFLEGDEHLALTLLRRARDGEVPGSPGWAMLERLTGLVLIHTLREVEGTFALERADAVLDAVGLARPTLAWLEEAAQAGEGR
ncbi:MAG: hypothetical protein AB1511_03840 [Deinococcota bacterium]